MPLSANSQPAAPPANEASASADGLQPALKSALSSLTIQLEHELARYRRAKREQAQTRSAKLRQADRAQPSLMGSPSLSPGSTPPPPPPNPRLHQESTDSAAYSDSDMNQVTNTTTAAIAPLLEPSPAITSTSISEVTALRSALMHPAAPSPSAGDEASSEALLDHFDQYELLSETAVDDRPASALDRWKAQLSTPLGVGLVALSLLASAGLGLVLVKPAIVQHLANQGPLANLGLGSTQDSAPGTVAADTVAGQPPSPLSPNLSEPEFTHLDLSRLNTLPSETVQSQGNTTAPRSSAAPPYSSPSQPQDQALSPPARVATSHRSTDATPPTTQAAPRATTTAPRATPVPKPSPAPTAPVIDLEAVTPPLPAPQAASSEAVSSTSRGSYYVVTDYTGDPSLVAARAVVSDAYLRNFDDGSFIQMGAFSSEAAAATLVTDLQEQGLNARVYSP